MKRLEGKVAVVTGSTSGIGVGIARLFAAEGAKVVVCGRREEKGQAVVNSIVEAGGEASYHYMDITDAACIEKLFEDTAAKYGKIDVLVNNAANVALKDGRVDELTIEMWDNIFQSDMRGTFCATKCVLPYLEKNENGGSIINCVRPGLIVTPENEAHVPQVLKDIFLSNIMVNRYGCPDDIGHMCVYLASDESSYVTGQIVNVDGGLNSHVPTVAQFRELNSRTW